MKKSEFKLVSYQIGMDSEHVIDKFRKFHEGQFRNIEVICSSIEGKPLNSCKIRAAEYVLSKIEEEGSGIYILCDIDTRILRLRGMKRMLRGYDAAFYFRHAAPMHLSNLSGFMIFNVTNHNTEAMHNFLETWISEYKSTSSDWYNDQRSLILAIYKSEISKQLKHVDLSKMKNKLFFNWSTTPTLLSDATTHKGRDKYTIFEVPYSLRVPALIIDQILFFYNFAGRIIRRVF